MTHRLSPAVRNATCEYCAVVTRVNPMASVAVTAKDRLKRPSVGILQRIVHPTEGPCFQWMCPECKVINRIPQVEPESFDFHDADGIDGFGETR